MSEPIEPTAPGRGDALSRKEAREHANRKRRRYVTLAIVGVVLLALIPVGKNYVDALRAPGTDAMGARTVEWMREHGFGPMVNSV